MGNDLSLSSSLGRDSIAVVGVPFFGRGHLGRVCSMNVFCSSPSTTHVMSSSAVVGKVRKPAFHVPTESMTSR